MLLDNTDEMYSHLILLFDYLEIRFEGKLFSLKSNFYEKYTTKLESTM